MVVGDSGVNGRWSAAEATDRIRALARDHRLSLAYKIHAMQRLAERGLVTGDVLFVLKHGFVYGEPVAATRPDFYRYQMESRTPNSDARVVRVVVIPDAKNLICKIVTVMWSDETATRAGTILND
jgi:DNA-binding transcriptional MocR family regulator